MRNFLLVLILPLLAGCGAMQTLFQDRQVGRELGELGTKVDGLFGKVGEKLESVRGEVVGAVDSLAKQEAEIRKQADKDGNGILEGDEKLQYLLLIAAAGAAEIGRRKVKKGGEEKQKKQDERFAEVEAMIEHERQKRKALEAAEIARLRALAEQAGAPKA